MRTTKKELLEMIEDMNDDAQIILNVRGNSTTDYLDERIVAFKADNGDTLIIQDRLSK